MKANHLERLHEGHDPNTLPVLRSFIETYQPTMPRPQLLLITHVLPTAVPFIQLLTKKLDVHVVGIPYSLVPQAADAIRSSGVSIVQPPSVQDVSSSAQQAIQRLTSGISRPFVVQEIGGYLADSWSVLAALPQLRGVVEDTHNGHWRYMRVANSLTYPVVSIAESPIKAIEDTAVGDAVVFSIERILREAFSAILRGMHVLVLGYGRIGSACAGALHHRGCQISVYDIDPVKLMRASMDGFRIGSKTLLLSSAELIIGASGSLSIDKEALSYVHDDTIIVSASSRQLEVDIAYLQAHYTATTIRYPVCRYERNGHRFFLLNNAFPINFQDYSILGRALDAVYSELFLCIRDTLERRLQMGFQLSSNSVHQQVAAAWCRVYAGI